MRQTVVSWLHSGKPAAGAASSGKLTRKEDRILISWDILLPRKGSRTSIYPKASSGNGSASELPPNMQKCDDNRRRTFVMATKKLLRSEEHTSELQSPMY